MAKNAEVVAVEEVVVVEVQQSPKKKFINDWLVSNFEETGVMDVEGADKAWAEARGDIGTGFAAGFYAELVKQSMTDDEFKAIIDAGSANVQKHRSHYNAIRNFANQIHTNLAGE